MPDEQPWVDPTTAEPTEPFTPCPTSGGRKGFKVITPKAGERLTLQALGSRVRGVITHFCYERSELCTARWGPCEGCQLGRGGRWEGYLPVRHPVNGSRLVLKITEAGYRNSRGLLALDGKLRGHIIEASRLGKSANWPVQYSVRTLSFDPDLPLSHDIGPTLCFMWRIGLDSVIGRSLLAGARADIETQEGNGHA